MAKAKWKVGDAGWRGYARLYGDRSKWYPEIRPFTVRRVCEDGSFELHCEGVMPGREGKRSPGNWINFGADPDIMHRTPEAALRQAKIVAASENGKVAMSGNQ